MPSEGFVFDQKPVFDWNQVPVGTVSEARRDPKTKQTRQLIVKLNDDASGKLGTSTLEVSAGHVFGVRRDGLMLDRSLSELKKIDQFAALLKK